MDRLVRSQSIIIKYKQYLSLHNLSKDSTCLKVTVRPKRMSMECTIYHRDPWVAPGGDSTNSWRTHSVSSEAGMSRSKSRSSRKRHNRRLPLHVRRIHSRYFRRREANPPTSGTYPSSTSCSSSSHR